MYGDPMDNILFHIPSKSTIEYIVIHFPLTGSLFTNAVQIDPSMDK